MPHKYTQTNSLTAIRDYCEKISPNLHQKTDLELIDIAQSENSESQLAKSLIINRYLPKVLKDSKRIFNGQNSDPWHRDDIIQTGIKAIIVASQLIKKFNCKIETLKEVQFVHQGIDSSSKISDSSFEDKDLNSYIDHAADQGIIDPSVYKPINLEKQYSDKEEQKRNIYIYKDLLTEKEWEILNLLNLGKEKNFILKNLNISKQRFSCITKNITQKIKKNSEECLPK